MPRQGRLHIPGGYYHVMGRGLGYVFQNRYRSILCDADSYLLELVRYIHLNPIRAGMVSTVAQLANYPWTGHSVILGNRQQSCQAVDDILQLFGKRVGTAKQCYIAFMSQEVDVEQDFSGGGLVRSYGGWENIHSLKREHGQRIGDERILGESDFVEEALEADELKLKEKAALQRVGWTVGSLIQNVCRYCGIDQVDIRTKGRSNKISRAKALTCYFGTNTLGLSTQLLATHLGMSQLCPSRQSGVGRLAVNWDWSTMNCKRYGARRAYLINLSVSLGLGAVQIRGIAPDQGIGICRTSWTIYLSRILAAVGPEKIVLL